MVSGTKFYIYGGGRWREVNINDGRVEGWGRARFVYPKRGKVQVANTRAVLAALRDLKAGQNSAVKDGAHLPCKKQEMLIKKDDNHQESTCDRAHCYHHSISNNNGCIPSKNKQVPKVSIATQCIAKIDAGIQTSLPLQTLSFPCSLNNQKSRKRRRETTSSDENVPMNIKTTATVHKNSPKMLPKLILHRKRSVTVSSEDNNDPKRKPKQKIQSLKLNKADSAKYNIYQRKRTNSSDSIVWVVLPKNKENIENHNSKQKKSSQTSVMSSDNYSFNSRPKLRPQSTKKSSLKENNRKKTKNRENQKATQRTVFSSDEAVSKYKSVGNLRAKSSVDETRQDQCKELIIDETDVEILRKYLLKHSSDFELLKFDQDDEYKKHCFFKINPLVNVTRCQRIARMLQRESQDDISLKDFASQLGLKSVSELSFEPKRYRMRKLKETKKYLDGSKPSQDKENSVQYHKNKGIKDFDKLKEHKNISSDKSKLHSSDSSESSSEEIHNDKVRRKSQRLEKLKESNKSSPIKRYELRKSGVDLNKNIHRKDLVEIFSSNNKTQKSDEDSSEAEEPRSSKKVHRRGQSKINDNKNLNSDVIISSDEESELEAFKSSKETNKKSQSKVNNKNRNYINLTQSKDGILNKSNENKRRTIDLTDSDEESSEEEAPKSSKEPNRRKQNKSNENKRRNIDLTDSEEETLKSSKKNNTRKQNKAYNSKTSPNKRRNIGLTDSDEGSSEEEAPKSSKEPNRRKQNKANVNKRRTIDLTDSDEESAKVPKSSKEPNRRKQSKSNHNKTKANRKGVMDLIDSSEKSSEDEPHKPMQMNVNKRSNIKHSDDDSEKAAKSMKEPNRKVQKARDNETVARKTVKDENSKNEVSYFKKDRNKGTDTLELDDNTNLSIDKIKSQAAKSKHTISKRPCSSSSREYSNLEDHAIVTWVSIGGRASCVNGNRIWQELQEQYPRIAGQSRSWHSLRNRYLRYILPKLGTLALPPTLEARLRAAAATGEFKSRKRAPRRNSIFELPPRGALSRRPGASRSLSSEPEEPPAKRHKHDHTTKLSSPSPKRVLRSSLPGEKEASPPRSRHSPRYSEITRHFADRHQKDNSTPSSSPAKKSATDERKETWTKNTALSKQTSPAKSSRSSLSLRRSFRNAQVTEKPPDKEQSRTRKLFNPSSML